MGLFWARIREVFPKVRENTPLFRGDPADIMGGAPGEMFPLPRFWFITGDDIHVLQLQRNALILNWRKRSEAYPHFDPLKAMFDTYYDRFVAFLGEEVGVSVPPIEVCELTYINIIEEGEYWNTHDGPAGIIPTIQLPDAGVVGLAPKDYSLSVTYPSAPDLTVAVTARSGKHLATGKAVLHLEIKGEGKLDGSTKGDADKWFYRAHDLIGQTFLGLTSEEIQKNFW